MTKYFAIISAKGGVGKTTTTLNLSAALAVIGRDVIAIDADLTAPNMSIYLGVPHLPRSIHDALEGKVPLTSCLYLHPSGLRIIPGDIAYESAKAISLDNFKAVLQELQGKVELVLVDGAPGVSQEAVTVIHAVDFVVLVTTPDIAAVSDARKTAKMAREQHKPVLGVIVNRVRGEEHEIDSQSIETFLEVPVLGTVPEDPAVRTAYQLKGPVVYIHPESAVAFAYKKIAAKIVGEDYQTSVEKKKLPSLGHDILAGWNLVKKN